MPNSQVFFFLSLSFFFVAHWPFDARCTDICTPQRVEETEKREKFKHSIRPFPFVNPLQRVESDGIGEGTSHTVAVVTNYDLQNALENQNT